MPHDPVTDGIIFARIETRINRHHVAEIVIPPKMTHEEAVAWLWERQYLNDHNLLSGFYTVD
jgi:hypothetical protein